MQLPEANPFIKAHPDVAERIFIMDINCFKAILNTRALEVSAADRANGGERPTNDCARLEALNGLDREAVIRMKGFTESGSG